MFTGLIEELGIVKSIQRKGQVSRLDLEAPKISLESAVGDSIAVNGVCLTVVEASKQAFSVDVVEETLGKSDIGNLRVGGKVNLERALKAEGRLGGHLVMGHVDGVGFIRKKAFRGRTFNLEISFPPSLALYIVSEGSIAVDGISLTIARVGREWLEIAIIPHTAEVTTLGFKNIGDKVNLEVDILGKYVEKALKQREVSSVDEELLRRAGFIG